MVEVFQEFHVILGKLAAEMEWELGLFPPKNGSCWGVKWGYYHLRKHPYSFAGFFVDHHLFMQLHCDLTSLIL